MAEEKTKREKDPTRLTQADIEQYLASEEERGKPKDILLNWQAPEFIQVSRPQQWYVLFAIVGILLVVYALITANYLFALIVVILAVVLNSFFNRKPKNLKIAITREGVFVENNFYSYENDLASFWILYDPPELKTLNFSRRTPLQPSMAVQLGDQNPLKVREVLLNYLAEDIEKEEHPVDATFRRWGF